MKQLSTEEKEALQRSIGQRIMVTCGLIPLCLTVQEVEHLHLKVNDIINLRRFIQRNPERFDYEQHKDYFTEDEISDMSMSLDSGMTLGGDNV